MSCIWSSSYNSWRWTSLSIQVYDSNEKNLPLVSRDKRSNPCHGEVKQVVLPIIELIQENNTTNKLPLRYKRYADMNPCLLSIHDHKVILEKFEARENLNYDEYVEEEDYYNVDSDESDIDAN